MCDRKPVPDLEHYVSRLEGYLNVMEELTQKFEHIEQTPYSDIMRAVRWTLGDIQREFSKLEKYAQGDPAA